MKKPSRELMEDFYSRFAGERTDGGKDLTLDDHLHCANRMRQMGSGPIELAEALGMPVVYAELLFRATQD